ncbi:MAG: FAD-dependent monooxygenase [Betaproteobacteria bacterium]|nr:FAD-dependent monooxygenase [Betaproteobacteria bacterium]
MRKVVVVGAGPVGATFALLAARLGVDITLLEAREGPSRESRSLALSHGSREILDTCGVWDGLAPTEILTIHTSQRGGFGRMRMSHDDAGVPALGYVLTYADLQQALDTQLEQQKIRVLRGAAVSAFDEAGDHVDVRYAHGGAEHKLEADAVILADGGANLSKVPSLKIEEKDYAQSALLGHITADRAHRGTAYERFTPEGPAALLPHGGEREYSMVWVTAPERIEELKTVDEATFLAAFREHFGHRAGRFTAIANRRSFPLKLRTVSSRVAGHIAVIGNAAQALHPVAGQGFNLGLRDADDLSRRLASSKEPAAQVLQQYETSRDRDVERSVGFTDFLVGAFSNNHLLTRVPRGIGLAMIDLLPGARRALAKRMLFGAAK